MTDISSQPYLATMTGSSMPDTAQGTNSSPTSSSFPTSGQAAYNPQMQPLSFMPAATLSQFATPSTAVQATPANAFHRLPKVVHLNFATTSLNLQGHNTVVKQGLLQNIRGFPVHLEEIRTIAALNSILLAYFSETLHYYGLSIHHLSGYGAVFFTQDTGSQYHLGPATTHESWNMIWQHLDGRLMSPNHCTGQQVKCGDCQIPPFVLVCIDDIALSNALLSKNLNSSVRFEFLDGEAQILKVKADRSCDALRNAYLQMTKDASKGQTVKSLTGHGSTSVSNADTNPQHEVAMYSHGAYLGKTRLPPVLAQHVPQILAQGNRIAITGRVVPTTPANAALPMSNLPVVDAPVTGSLKRPAPDDDSDDDDSSQSERYVKPRLSKQETLDERARKLSAADWDRLSCAKPTGNTKPANKSCLTCIAYKRSCKTTTLDDAGRCENCQGHGPQKKSSRRCYWQDLPNGIRTYNDAHGIDPKGRNIHANTRAARELRRRSQAPSSARSKSTKQSVRSRSSASTPTRQSIQSQSAFIDSFTIVDTIEDEIAVAAVDTNGLRTSNPGTVIENNDATESVTIHHPVFSFLPDSSIGASNQDDTQQQLTGLPVSSFSHDSFGGNVGINSEQQQLNDDVHDENNLEDMDETEEL